ncbi:MAG: Tab2/Atab2 family RNA-binding protein [Gloeomargaritaceae cyanobacterium C42_A2020_066]|nr:Tab2/Atab2 family RNA-binding protein [Gloeomargaritaceae cyanobacterium C42_A2020_066]
MPQAPIWELDFYSRPVLDDQGKKIWELLLCDREGTFQLARRCPPDQVNSAWLTQALQEVIQSAGRPSGIRFFRQPMANMINRACAELQLTTRPSRRTLALIRWLEQRWQAVYPEEPGFQPLAAPPPQPPPAAPQPLPDALRGQRWAFVTLPLLDLRGIEPGMADFGDGLPWPQVQVNPAENPTVPGVAVYTQRAAALAAWMSGLELASFTLETGPPARLILETGLDDRWVFAPLGNLSLAAAGRDFDASKRVVKGLHFLAIQTAPDVETCAGFWLLQEIPLP